MLATFLAYFDQFRAVVGLIAACFLFCRHVAPRRDRFFLRVAGYSMVCLAVGFTYVPLSPVFARLPTVVYGFLSIVYWLTFDAAVCVMVFRCYEMPLGSILFRMLLGCVLESIPTTFIRYLMVMMWLPELPYAAPVGYILLVMAVYTLMYWGAYVMLARPLQRGGTVVKDDPASLWIYGVIILAFLLIMYSTNGICEWVIPSMGDGFMQSVQGRLMRYFCVGIRFLVSTAFFTSQYYVYQTNFLQYERDLTSQLLREKSEQYEFTKENIEFIQRKCHDLKRQLQALELAGEEERKAKFAKYFSGDIKDISDGEFEALLGRPIPDGHWSGTLDMNDAICQLYYAKSWIARQVYKIMTNMLNKSIAKGEPDLNITFIYNMPFRGIAKMAGGMCTTEMAEGILTICNGHFFKGLGRVIGGFFRSGKRRKAADAIH